MLSIGDVDLARDVIRFRRAKGGKTLEVALHRETKAAVSAYLERGRPRLPAAAIPAANALGSTPPDPSSLFLSSNTETGPRALTMSAISTMLTRRYHRGGGTLARFGSHRIRHATATMLVNNGMSLEEVSRFLGHSSTMPTRRYAQQSPGALGKRRPRRLSAPASYQGDR